MKDRCHVHFSCFSNCGICYPKDNRIPQVVTWIIDDAAAVKDLTESSFYTDMLILL